MASELRETGPWTFGADWKQTNVQKYRQIFADVIVYILPH